MPEAKVGAATASRNARVVCGIEVYIASHRNNEPDIEDVSSIAAMIAWDGVNRDRDVLPRARR
jgi:hypothetical protein